MYNYSPIRKIYIRNFRNLGDVELSFEKSPIITLVGENEAGKTSIVKAFATCALHASPRDQKDYIRDGTRMFGVSVEFENNVRVTRIKETAGINSYQIVDANGNVVFSTNKLAEGLPEEVQKLMGLIVEPETNEFLHIRTYEDKLLFVVTPNSTNYKVMYNALKVEQLTKAIKLGSTEVNGLKSAISSNDASMETLQYQARSITIVDTEPLTSVRDRLKEQLALLDKLEKIKQLSDRVNNCEIQLGALALIDRFKLETIDELMASKLCSINRLLSNYSETVKLLSRLNDISSIDEISVNVLNKSKSIVDKINSLDCKVKETGALVHLTEISEISEVTVMQLNKSVALLESVKALETQRDLYDTSSCSEIDSNAISSIDNLEKVSSLLNTIKADEDQLSQVNQYIGQVQTYLKQCGVAFETCPNCGSDVIIDIDKIEMQ